MLNFSNSLQQNFVGLARELFRNKSTRLPHSLFVFAEYANHGEVPVRQRVLNTVS
jgi:hypothetical protein